MLSDWSLKTVIDLRMTAQSKQSQPFKVVMVFLLSKIGTCSFFIKRVGQDVEQTELLYGLYTKTKGKIHRN